MRNKVLVADDDAEVVELLRFNLAKAGFAVGTARNGIETVKKVRSIAPDVIVLDLMMPELDGLAVCEILRRDQMSSLIPIVMLTAHATELGRSAGLESGATAYMTKPFSPHALIDTIQHLMREAHSPLTPQAEKRS